MRCDQGAGATGAVRGLLVAPFCDNKRIKALTNTPFVTDDDKTSYHVYEPATNKT